LFLFLLVPELFLSFFGDPPALVSQCARAALMLLEDAAAHSGPLIIALEILFGQLNINFCFCHLSCCLLSALSTDTAWIMTSSALVLLMTVSKLTFCMPPTHPEIIPHFFASEVERMTLQQAGLKFVCLHSISLSSHEHNPTKRWPHIPSIVGRSQHERGAPTRIHFIFLQSMD
jgi:hypothetical protein